jgi:hypothetical protein
VRVSVSLAVWNATQVYVCVCVRVSDFWEFLTEKGGIPTLPTRSMATRGDVRVSHLPVTLL